MADTKHCEPSLWSRFKRDVRGAIAMNFALAIVPMLGILSLAFNYASASQRRSDYQSIVDSAVLAGTTASTTDSDAVRQQRAIDWFNAQISLKNLPPATATAYTSGGVLTVETTVDIAPTIAILFSDNLSVKVSASAQIAQSKIRRVLDVAFCIDATGSMQPTIDSVKARANSFSSDLNAALQARGLEQFDYSRIRAVFYRDFSVDVAPYGPMSASSFFVMPGDSTSLTNFLGTEIATGGGDEPESSYECINEGMSSPWFKKGQTIPGLGVKADSVYPVVVLWSDANARPIPDTLGIAASLYPATMPQTETGFSNKWNSSTVIDQENKMLVHFGLCAEPSWALARSLGGYMCGGTLSDGNSNMVNKIADAMVVRYKNLNTRLSR